MLLDDHSHRAVIDCMRAVGIILVICFHVVIGLTTLLEADSMPQYIDALPGLFNVMWQALGSEIIFLFSGFLLAYLLLREHLRHGRIDIGDFYVRRMSRIVPLYLIAILLYALIRDFDAIELLWNLLFVSKLFDATTIVPVGWSLEVLVQSYFLLPLAVSLLLRSGHPVKLCLAAIVAALANRYFAFVLDPESYQVPIHALFAGTDTTETQDKTYYLLGYRATPFLLGFLAAYIVVHKESALQNLYARRGIPQLLLLGSFVVIAGSGFLPVHDPRSFLYAASNEPFWLWFWVLQRFVFSIGICMLALTLWYGRSRLIAPVVSLAQWRVWKQVSQNIYSIYLFHPVFLIPGAVIGFRAVEKEAVVPVHVLEVAATIAVVTLFTTLFGNLVTRYVELPAQAWIRARFGRPRTPG